MGIPVDIEEVEVASPPQPAPFRFKDLPAELRLRIYELYLVRAEPIDLSPENGKTIAPTLKLLRVCRQIHDEASSVFYGRNTFRIFATTFATHRHLIARLPKRYRECLTALELRLGSGWTKPPKSWNVMKKQGLQNCINVRELKIFIELDPSQHDILRHFLPSENSYTRFCVDLFRKILDKIPTIGTIEFDGWDSIRKDGNLTAALIKEARYSGRKIKYGPEHGWTASGIATPITSYDEDVQTRLLTGGIVSSLAAATLPVAAMQA